jgi:hypothetical protein
LQSQNLGAINSHLCAFDRVIVDQEKAFQSKIQFLSKCFEIIRFLVPVESPGDKMFPFEEHLFSLLKDLEDIFLVILAAQTDQHAGFHLFDGKFLQVTMTFGDTYAEDAILGANPLPKGVVTIKNDNLERLAIRTN